MRKVHIEKVQLGTRLAKTIFKSDGGVLLSEGIELRDSFVERLRSYGVHEVFIHDEISQGIEVSELVREETRYEAKALVKKMMDNYLFEASLDVEEIKQAVDRMIHELLENPDIMNNLSSIRTVDDYTFEHSVNVCILSLITGIGLGFDQERLRDLGVGAMLHDIGKLRIPQEILKKPSQLTVEEFEEIKKHTLYGYEILKNSGKVSVVSAFIAFGHHERFDGTGYPLQLKSDNIHLCARIVAVADVYDALTSDRVYRKKLRPHEVYEYITSLGAHHFDLNVVSSFVRYVAVYPVGTGVMLNTRERALVVRANRNMPTRPVIRIIYDKNKNRVIHSEEIDLSVIGNLMIIGHCEI